MVLEIESRPFTLNCILSLFKIFFLQRQVWLSCHPPASASNIPSVHHHAWHSLTKETTEHSGSDDVDGQQDCHCYNLVLWPPCIFVFLDLTTVPRGRQGRDRKHTHTTLHRGAF